MYWSSVFVVILTMSLLIYCIVINKLNPHIMVTIQELSNMLVMLMLIILILCMYYIYGSNYPLLRDERSTDVACMIHSVLTVIMMPLPSTSLLLLSIVHYRAVFWSKYDTKLNIKSMLLPILLTWFVTILLSALWASFHEQYSKWYCIPFSHSVFSVILQSTISVLCLACFFTFIKYYVEMITYVRKEEQTVMAMRSRKFSNARLLLVRFIITTAAHIAQLVLMNLMLWLPLSDVSDATIAMIYAAYIHTVACTDVYLHTYITLKKRFSDFKGRNFHFVTKSISVLSKR